jgi:hypothetical protein
MYCTNCGTPRAETATSCTNCGAVVEHFPVRPPVQNYLVHAILASFCCCLPLGVVAIIYAAQVNSKLASGDIPAAMTASRRARTWCWIAFAGGILSSIGSAAWIYSSAAGLK